jgi:hypothetical protein
LLDGGCTFTQVFPFRDAGRDAISFLPDEPQRLIVPVSTFCVVREF